MLYMNQVMSLTFLPLHTTPLSTTLLHIDATVPQIRQTCCCAFFMSKKQRRGCIVHSGTSENVYSCITVWTCGLEQHVRGQMRGPPEHNAADEATEQNVATGAQVQYRVKLTGNPRMMPMIAGIRMELTGKPALIQAMKTIASRPSFRGVVKARTQIPHLPSLAFNCTTTGEGKQQSLAYVPNADHNVDSLNAAMI